MKLKNKFKIVTGFNPTNSISYLKENGINEVYCGYYDKESESKCPVLFGCIKRRGEGVNFFGWDKLCEFSRKAYKQKILVYVTLNSHYYIKEQYKWLIKATKEMLSKETKNKNIDRIVFNDIDILNTTI